MTDDYDPKTHTIVGHLVGETPEFLCARCYKSGSQGAIISTKTRLEPTDIDIDSDNSAPRCQICGRVIRQ